MPSVEKLPLERIDLRSQAIRMVTDLGLHLYKGNLEGLEGLEPDDLEIRKRLYLSAYAWDK